ncbi:hypothetical protein [Streptomyces sp. NPDC006739]|uniref:hypothetical protein n=1 Tax=Streptomyces sp. NPDC006739 TaxID=3364763 RepID=UPI00367A96C3
MSEYTTPSQAEGEPEPADVEPAQADRRDAAEPPRTTPSQAEGEAEEDGDAQLG